MTTPMTESAIADLEQAAYASMDAARITAAVGLLLDEYGANMARRDRARLPQRKAEHHARNGVIQAATGRMNDRVRTLERLALHNPVVVCACAGAHA